MKKKVEGKARPGLELSLGETLPGFGHCHFFPSFRSQNYLMTNLKMRNLFTGKVQVEYRTMRVLSGEGKLIDPDGTIKITVS